MSDKPLPDRFVLEREADLMTGLSRGTRWRLTREGEFPQKYQIAPKKYAYRESELIAWMDSRPATKIKPPSNYFEKKGEADNGSVQSVSDDDAPPKEATATPADAGNGLVYAARG